MIVWPLCRTVFGDMRLPAYKYSQKSGVGPMGVLGSAVPVFAHASAQSLMGDMKLCADGRVGGSGDCLLRVG